MGQDRISLALWADGNKTVYFTGNTYAYRDMIKAIPGAQWAKPLKMKAWQIPLENVTDAKRILPSIDIDQKVLTAYNDLQARQEQALKVKDSNIVNLGIKGIKSPNGWKPRTFQNAGVLFADTLGPKEGCIFAFDMGLGKSATGLLAFQKAKNEGRVDYLLVVCPAPLKYATWEKEIKLWTDLEYVIIDGDKTEKVEYDDGTWAKLRGRQLREVQYQQHLFGVPVMVVNYELFLHDLDIMPLVNERWMVILDECQRIKSPKAQTTKNIMNHLEGAGRKILASGTPLENNIPELFTLVDFCRKGMLGNQFKFIERYMEKDFFGKPIAPKPQMMDELRKKIAPIMIRKTKEEALPELPPMLGPFDYWVTMGTEQQKLYSEVRAGILKNMETGEFNYLEILAQITRLQQVVDSPALLSGLMGKELPRKSAKLDELFRIVEDIDWRKNKIIIFSQYKQMTDILADELTSGPSPIVPKARLGYVHGGMKSTDIGRIQSEFQTGNYQVVILTTAGNYGLDLWAASYVIAYDCLFNPQKMNQIYSRAHRSGNTKMTAINILTKNSYEERKVEILVRKRELFKAMIDADDETFAKMFSKQELLGMIDDDYDPLEDKPRGFAYESQYDLRD